MMNHSTWNAVDLHIHSRFSNKVKGKNDYKGDNYCAKELLDTLKEKGISIFSITDHNSINVELYEEICNLIDQPKYRNMSYLIGTELDVKDKNINNNETFHCLLFFDTYEVKIVKTIIDEIFKNLELSKRNNEETYPDIKDIFDAVSGNGVNDILIIPHFNNKAKGIKTREAVEHLNYLCFNAYEDSNNIKNVSKSLQKYLESGYSNFPFAVFSDCHDLSVYPKKDRYNHTNPAKCHMLSSISYPFDSIRTAFEEPRMRISIESIDGMRSIENNGRYIDTIIINNQMISLSPYQNTIIGKFGSGKSLLLEKIKLGSLGLEGHEKYKELYNRNENFKLSVGTAKYNSIKEVTTATNIKHYDGLQHEDYYFDNILKYKEFKKLISRMNLKFDFDSKFKTINLIDNISDKTINFYNTINSSEVINTFNYEQAFNEEKFYSFSIPTSYDYLKEYNEIIEGIKSLNSKVREIRDYNLHGEHLFTLEEIETIQATNSLLESKKNLLEKLREEKFEYKIHNLLSKYNKKYIDNIDKESKEKLIESLKQININLLELFDSINVFEKLYNQQTHREIFNRKVEKINDNLSIEYCYNEQEEFVKLEEHLFASENRRDNAFISIVHASLNKLTLKGKRNIEQIDVMMKKYIDDLIINLVIENTIYDFIYKDKSVLKRSPGEKASLFIEIIFELIEMDLKSGINVILTIDQPEDNIDNDNTYNLISNKIKELKLKYNNFQIIVVTHNANVGISADSENIIIAQDIRNEKDQYFKYTSGAIENNRHIDLVCRILEGGEQALRRRTLKYGINIIRKVEKNDL